MLCQPSAPFVGVARPRRRPQPLPRRPRGRQGSGAARAAAVLGVRYASDPLAGNRFETLTTLLGDAFIRVDLEGRGHSTVTEHRSQRAVDAVLEFFGERLHA